MQVLLAWEEIAQQAERRQCAADKLQQRQARKALHGYFGSWAAHAECLRERRQVASAHGSATAKRLAQDCARMSFLVSIPLSSSSPAGSALSITPVPER